MIDFYNAFISYRHAKLDSAIAAHVQRKLEHTHVPHKLKKKLRHQKITRIFRDKDELPITSDLTETITNALRQAEYLIVICSTNTKDSFWVKREIQTFLQTHTADKILTVLCDGEPFDVIPQELLSMEKEYVDENGIRHTVKVPVEPLSCDYRMKRSIADKEELPRLASALLGCSYDELQRRNRQYRIRRAAAVIGAAFAALVAFGCYMGYTSKKINDNYIESLRSRSLYLANEAEQLLDAGKRVDANQLALAALPGGPKDKMPVTAQAVRAVTYTTGAYKTNTGATFMPVWNYKTLHPVKQTLLSDDTFYLGALDETGDVYCWDTTSHELLFEKAGMSDLIDFFFMENDSLLIVYNNRIEAYNIKAGALMWKYDAPEGHTFYNGDVVYAAHAVYFDNGDGSVSKVAAKDGTVKDTYKVKDSIMSTIYKLTVSPDGKKIAYADSAFLFGDEQLHIYDTETGKNMGSPVETFYIWGLKFIDDGHLCVLSSDDMFNSSAAFSDEMTFKQTGYMSAFCFDTSMKLLWNTELAYNDVESGVDALYLPKRDSVLLYIGDTAEIYKVKTGEKTNSYLTGSSVVTAGDLNDDGLPEFICKHGEYIFALNEDNNSLAAYNVLCDKITAGIADKQLYAVQSGSNDIICYNRFLEDEEFTEIESYGGFNTGSTFRTSYADDEHLIIAARVSETELVRVSVIDIEEGKLLFSEDVEASEGLLSCFSIENIDGTIYGIFGYTIYEIDIKDKTVEKTGTELDYGYSVSNGKIIKVDPGYSEWTITVTDLDGSGEKEMTLDDPEGLDSFSVGQPVYIEQYNKLLIPAGTSMLVADLKSGKISEMDVPENWNVSRTLDFYVTLSDDGSRLLMTDGHMILVTDDKLKEQYTIRCNYYHRCSAGFKKNTLYVVADGYLFLYDAGTGDLTAKYEMTLYGNGRSDLGFDDANHLLYFQTGDQISIFDTNTWVEIACIKNAYCYHAGTDRFFVYSYLTSSECTPGYFRHYSLDDLIEKANALVGGQELPVEIKSKYGI